MTRMYSAEHAPASPLPQDGYMAVLEATTLELQMEIAPELTSSVGARPQGPASYATALACFGAAADGTFVIAVGTNQGTVKVGLVLVPGCLLGQCARCCRGVEHEWQLCCAGMRA